MYKKSKMFYIWIMKECIKDTYENWGTDMMSIYDNITLDFPNASNAISKMYIDFNSDNIDDAKILTFEKPQYVYEIIANLIPLNKHIRFDIRTRVLNKKYKGLDMLSWNRFEQIDRIDLIIAMLLFTEEFILDSLSNKNIVYTENKLIVYHNYVTFKISKHDDKTYVSIRIRNVILFEYIMLN